MNALIVLTLTLVAVLGFAVVVATTPERQAVTLSVFGLALALLFMVLQAPDVALSQIGIGSAIVPLMVMLAIRTMRRTPAADSGADDNREDGVGRDGRARDDDGDESGAGG